MPCHHFRTPKYILNIYTRAKFPSQVVFLWTQRTQYTAYSVHNVIYYTFIIQQEITSGPEHINTCVIVQHFNMHPIVSLIIYGLESDPNWTPGQRRRAEGNWIRKLTTRTLLGLNERIIFSACG